MMFGILLSGKAYAYIFSQYLNKNPFQISVSSLSFP